MFRVEGLGFFEFLRPSTQDFMASCLGIRAGFLVLSVLLAVLAYFWTRDGGISVDRRSVLQAWPDSNDIADENAYNLLQELGNDPAVVKLMRRHRLHTGYLRELGRNDPNYEYTRTEVLQGYNEIQVSTLVYHGITSNASARTSVYIALRVREPPGNIMLRRQSVIHTLLHELAHCRYEGSADKLKHMRADVSDPAERQFRDFLGQLEVDYRALQKAVARSKTSAPQSRDLRLRVITSASAVSSRVRQLAAKSYSDMNLRNCLAGLLLMWLLRKLLYCRAGSFARGQEVRTKDLPAMHLNGVEGVLVSYNLWRGVWSLRRRNGAIILVRTTNLERLLP